jgi:hypothetical protein
MIDINLEGGFSFTSINDIKRNICTYEGKYPLLYLSTLSLNMENNLKEQWESSFWGDFSICYHIDDQNEIFFIEIVTVLGRNGMILQLNFRLMVNSSNRLHYHNCIIEMLAVV